MENERRRAFLTGLLPAVGTAFALLAGQRRRGAAPESERDRTRDAVAKPARRTGQIEARPAPHTVRRDG